MLSSLSAVRTKLRTPTYPVNAVFPLSWLKTSVTIKAAGNSVMFTAPIHYPKVPAASREILAKGDVLEYGYSDDIPKEVVEPIIESWNAFARTWSFNAPWWGGSVAQISMAIEIVKPKRLKESADLLSYPALKYAAAEYIEANYHHIYVNNERLTLYSGPEQWAVGHSKNSPYISVSMLRQGGHTREILNFFPLDRERLLCFGFNLYRGGKAASEQEVEKQIPAAPMIKLINDLMSSVEIHRKGDNESEAGFSDEKFIEEAKANPLTTDKPESFSQHAS
ncbi:hypothetical protein L1F30_12285 [Simiduia sp. 21SJ11W-1]|uniref:hypothetical protein n=1 Tax=Simiduia sp. 21SJ11W-1 TaxID=2909669 RepID=UPI00209D2DAE|nr:hypothetical protein [Simiduia sp. 21SJ11W-1]UTA46939.1 hypothetical protein L1F30_12285 [Simiduia sp. 21SJ11W-1]